MSLACSLSDCLSVGQPLTLYMFARVWLCMIVSISHSVSVCLSVRQFLGLSHPFYLSVCLSFCVSVSTCHPLCLFVGLSICLSLRPSVYRSLAEALSVGQEAINDMGALEVSGMT